MVEVSVINFRSLRIVWGGHEMTAFFDYDAKDIFTNVLEELDNTFSDRDLILLQAWLAHALNTRIAIGEYSKAVIYSRLFKGLEMDDSAMEYVKKYTGLKTGSISLWDRFYRVRLLKNKYALDDDCYLPLYMFMDVARKYNLEHSQRVFTSFMLDTSIYSVNMEDFSKNTWSYEKLYAWFESFDSADLLLWMLSNYAKDIRSVTVNTKDILAALKGVKIPEGYADSYYEWVLKNFQDIKKLATTDGLSWKNYLSQKYGLSISKVDALSDRLADVGFLDCWFDGMNLLCQNKDTVDSMPNAYLKGILDGLSDSCSYTI